MPTPQDTTDTSPIAPSTPGEELCALTATELARRIRQKQVSARDVMAAHLARIERVNPKVNAIVTLVADARWPTPRKADEQQARGVALGPLHGLPVAHKDLVATRRHPHDVRLADLSATTSPTKDALIVDAHPRGGRDHARQDEHAGVRRRIADVQPGLRRDAQSLRPREDRAAAAAAAPRRRSRRAWCRSPTAATPAARCAIPRRSATSSASGRRRAACRTRTARGRRSRRADRWRARWRTSRCFLSAIAGPLRAPIR